MKAETLVTLVTLVYMLRGAVTLITLSIDVERR